MPRGIHMLGRKLSETTKIKMRESSKKRKEELGYINSPEARKKLSDTRKRLFLEGKLKMPPCPSKKGIKLTEEHKRKIKINTPKYWLGKKRFSVEEKTKIGNDHRGEKCYFWKGGISSKDGYDAIRQNTRRARKANNGGSHTIGEWENLKKQYNFACPCCNKNEPEIKLTEDHIIPIAKGGSNNIENIQPLCLKCNQRKSTKIIKYEGVIT